LVKISLEQLRKIFSRFYRNKNKLRVIEGGKVSKAKGVHDKVERSRDKFEVISGGKEGLPPFVERRINVKAKARMQKKLEAEKRLKELFKKEYRSSPYGKIDKTLSGIMWGSLGVSGASLGYGAYLNIRKNRVAENAGIRLRVTDIVLPVSGTRMLKNLKKNYPKRDFVYTKYKNKRYVILRLKKKRGVK